MAITAENLGEKYQITRLACDEYSFKTQQRYKAAFEKKYFAEEIMPVKVVSKKGEVSGEDVMEFEVQSPADMLKIADHTFSSRLFTGTGKFARPDEIRFTEALPKTRSGKIMRRLLKDVAAGVVTAARAQTAQAGMGVMYELDAIAAVVIGGTSLSGGIGTISGTVIGAFVIGILRNGLNMGGVSAFTQQIVIDLVILLTVWIDQMRHRR